MPIKIDVAGHELWNEKTEEFIIVKPTSIVLEHSLVAISKWESKWHVPFLSKKTQKTNEQIEDYIRCMCVTQNVDPNVFKVLSEKNINDIKNYIDDPHTATTFSNNDHNSKGSSEQITSELIYYWMVAAQIPWECQKWHISRLLTLINICSIKNAPPKKMSKRELAQRNHNLNKARHTKFKH